MQLGASKKGFNKLFREAITTSKDIKNTTKYSQQPLSISYIGVKFLEEKIGSFRGEKCFSYRNRENEQVNNDTFRRRKG